MGLGSVQTTDAYYEGLRLPVERLGGCKGQALQIAFSALDSERLGSPWSPSAWRRARSRMRLRAPRSVSVRHAGHQHQGLAFLLADMAAAVDSACATYPDAARRRAAGVPYCRQALVAKLIATDGAMR